MLLNDQTDRYETFKDAKDEEILSASITTPALFEILVNKYQNAFVRKARSIIGPREEVADVVMETFTKIYTNAGRFREVQGASFSSWGYKILINTSLSYYQKIKRRNEAIADIEPEHYESLADARNDFKDNEIRDTIATLISRLPKPFERILELHIMEDKSQEEVAKIEGISIAAVKTRVHRARKELKKIQESSL